MIKMICYLKFELNKSLSLEKNSPKIKFRLASYEWPEELRKRFQSQGNIETP